MSWLPLRTTLEGWVDDQISVEPDPATRTMLTRYRAHIVNAAELIMLRPRWPGGSSRSPPRGPVQRQRSRR